MLKVDFKSLQQFFIKYFYGITFCIIVFLGLQHIAIYGINTAPDTVTYFNPHTIDSLISAPLYPIFLVCYNFLFGTKHLLFLGQIQVVIACVAIVFSIKKLEEFLGLNKFLIVLVLFVYIKFYFWYGFYNKIYFDAYGVYGNWVLTEALSYPLFLIFIPLFWELVCPIC